MKFPSVLLVTVLTILPPMLVPWIQTFWPSANYWWSALAIILLNSIVVIIKVMRTQYPELVPGGPDGAQAAPVSAPAPRGKAYRIFIQGA